MPSDQPRAARRPRLPRLPRLHVDHQQSAPERRCLPVMATETGAALTCPHIAGGNSLDGAPPPRPRPPRPPAAHHRR